MLYHKEENNVKDRNMKNIALKLSVILLKIIYIPIKLFRTKNKVVYISRQSNTEPMDFRLIKEEIEKKHPEVENVIIAKKIEEGIVNKIKYCINALQQMYHISTSKVVILDTYCITACVLKHKKGTKIIQIWHALGAIKKFGYQTIGKESGSSEKTAKIMCMHQNYDYVLAPSDATGKHYQKAFNIDKEKIKYLGMPRIDYILKEDEEIKEKIYDIYPILKEKTNILYVPTFRKGEKVEIDDFVEKIDTRKYNLIIKLHPLDLKDYNYIKKDGVIYENKIKTYDLLKIADKVITDYSSLAIEASIINKPIYFYTYDIEKYQNDPGLNLNFKKEKIGKYQTTKVEDLLKLIDEQYDYKALEQFSEKYVNINLDNCTNQLVEFIMRLIYNEKDKNMDNKSSQRKYSVQKNN